MNYYPFHVGDYAAHTAHLEPMEDLAYRRLLDQYYLREGALPADIQATAKLVRMRSFVADVESVLNEFFTLTDAGWVHKRCDAEIERMQDKQAKARASAKASVEARKSKSLSDRSASAKQEPSERSANAEIKQANVELPTPTPTPVIDTPIPPSQATGAGSAKQAVAVSLMAWLAMIKAAGEEPMPETDPVFDYAEQAGIPIDMLRLCWVEFRSRYSEPGAKRYKDWRAVYRKAVRGNWLKLWRINAEGVYVLTTEGQQAQRVFDAKYGVAA